MIVKVILNYCMGLVYSENDHLIIETFDKIIMLGILKKKSLDQERCQVLT